MAKPDSTTRGNMAEPRGRTRETEKKKKEQQGIKYWDKRAQQILQHPKVQKPRTGEGHEGYRLTTAASTLPRSQQPWPPALEEREGKEARLISERYVACDDDGVVLAAYYPGYLVDTVVRQVTKALKVFTEAYPPPSPSERDLRHTDWESLCKLCGGKESVGLYHLCTWFEQGHSDRYPVLSADAGPRGARNFAAVLRLIGQLQVLTFCLSLLYRVLSRKSWAKSIDVVSNVCKRNPASKNIRSGKWDAWTGRVILANMPTHAHRDLQDSLATLTAIACFGSFAGGHLVLPNLQVKFPFQPGDVIFINSRLLQHFVTEWKPVDLPDGTRGGRYSIVHFVHAKIAEWAEGDVRPEL